MGWGEVVKENVQCDTILVNVKKKIQIVYVHKKITD